MCGLFGILGRGIMKDDLGVFRDLMVMSAVRGIDSTGVVMGNSNGSQVNVVKKVADPIYFLQTLTRKEEDMFDNVGFNYFIGHTRWATRGDKTVKAAQPFEYGRIVGTHNGTLDMKFEGFASDSDVLYSRINELGINAVIHHQIKKNDSYALVYYDKAKHRVCVLRNEKRELFFAMHEKREVMYYSSELGILRACMARHGFLPTACYFSSNTHYTFNPSDLRDKKGEYKFDSYELKPLGTPETKEAAAEDVPFDTANQSVSHDV